MSEQKLVSPLLDGFTIGSPMSDHDGVRSCPAIKEYTDKKYIVKIISVPASQVQMDALLLAGAYRDPADAMEYYKTQAEDIVGEAELLQKLSRLEGFLPYEGWQIEPITRRRLGYEVYLLGTYKRTLEKHLHRNPMTHLEALNLSLDMCAALSVCRQAGFLYVDLKPSNIYMSEQKECRIGDIGFLSLDALKYTTIPDRYRSCYTPEEFNDPMAPLNATADTYALGMILYQIYNESQLPVRSGEDEPIPSPINADYELAEIILKAIHADPEQRWQTPAEMGQALVSYMQRNVVNDTPITPHVPLEVPAEEAPAEIQEVPENAPDEVPEDVLETAEESAEPAAEQETDSAEIPEEESVEVQEADAQPVSEADDTAPGEDDADLMLPHEMSEELSRIVAKADDLIAHETPEGVVVPEAPELPDPFAFATEDSEEIDDSSIPLDPVMDEPEEEVRPVKKKKKTRRFVSPESKRRVRRFLTSLLLLLVLMVAGLLGFVYYEHIYTQTISALIIDGTDNQLSVTIDTEADESLLRVVCSDTYGNVRTVAVTDGKAYFTDLLPDTMYTIELKIDGFHRLSGETSDVFTTDANTKIVSFTAVTGPEDGSAVLNFTVDGEEPDEWTVVCSAEGEAEIRETFSGHSVAIKGLTVGKIYTFTLYPDDKLTLSGETSMEFMASRLILAQNISADSQNGDDLVVRWNAPGDLIVDSWDVRCYNIKGFEVQFTVDENKAVIPGVDLAAGYTVEITAAGMTQPARFSISENPAVIESFDINDADENTPGDLALSWQFAGEAPSDGWLLMYTVDGAATPNVIKCKEASATVSPRIPGAKYRFTLQAADGTSVLNNIHGYESPEAAEFDLHSLSAKTVTAQLLKTPADTDWRYESISDRDFTSEFVSGDKISVVLRAESPFYLPGSETRILYVYRDTHGNVLNDLVYEETVYWKNIWAGGDAKTGELDIPTAPVNPGEYVLDIYIEGMTMAQLSLTIQ